jgi:hypothetical protein
VCGPNESLYLERASYPVLDATSAADTLGARVVADDALFNAALVSFGSMGIIRGVVIETRPLFTLETNAFTHPYNEGLRKAMEKLDFSGLTLPDGQPISTWQNGRDLYHFELIFNPNDPANDSPADSNLAHLNLMVDDPDTNPDTWEVPSTEPADLQPGGAEIMARVLAALGPIGNIARGMINDEIRRHLPSGSLRAPMRYLFRGQVPQPRAFASGVSVPADRSPEAFDIALEVYRGLNKTLPVLVSGRYVKKTAATLGFTHFDNTCVLEIDGISGVGVERYLDRVLDELETAGIPFALHWGKAIDRYDQPGALDKAFGADVLADWKRCRAEWLATPALRRLFTNDVLTRIGLAPAGATPLAAAAARRAKAAKRKARPTRPITAPKTRQAKKAATKTLSRKKAAGAKSAEKTTVKRPKVSRPTSTGRRRSTSRKRGG